MSISERGQGGGGGESTTSGASTPAVSGYSEGDSFYNTTNNTLYKALATGAGGALVWVDISTAGLSSGGWQQIGTDVSLLDSGVSVGIGTESPTSDLHVKGVDAAFAAVTIASTGNGSVGLVIDRTSHGSCSRTYTLSSSFDSTGQCFALHASNMYNLLKIYTPSGDATLLGTLTENSDERTKEDISDLGLGVDYINTLRPVSYKRKGLEDQRVYSGLIAQEIEAATPESAAVSYDADSDRYGLAYSQFIAPLIKSVQELSARVVELEAKVGE